VSNIPTGPQDRRIIACVHLINRAERRQDTDTEHRMHNQTNERLKHEQAFA
jgi:hypothetical protein